MKTISIADSVVISLALRAEIRRNVHAYKRAVEFSSDMKDFWLDEIRDLVHAYEAINGSSFDDDVVYLLRDLK